MTNAMSSIAMIEIFGSVYSTEVECHHRVALYLIWSGEGQLSKEVVANPVEN
jgi:hypothetical protein